MDSEVAEIEPECCTGSTGRLIMCKARRGANMTSETLYYNPALLKRWLSGELPALWFRKYPKVFDRDDLRITKKDTLPYNFAEWLVAIDYAKRGYRILVEKYLCKNHPCKGKTLSGVLTPKQIKFLWDGPTGSHDCMPPDLFVYKGRRYFFVNVKRDSDRLTPLQERWFKDIGKKLKCGVVICRLKRKDN